jgi:hypothetical protein
MQIDLGEFHELIKMGLVNEIELCPNRDLLDIIRVGTTVAWSIDSDDELHGLVAFAGEDYEDIRYCGPPELETAIKVWMHQELYGDPDG